MGPKGVVRRALVVRFSAFQIGPFLSLIRHERNPCRKHLARSVRSDPWMRGESIDFSRKGQRALR